MENKITIEIRGTAGSGKTTLAQTLEEFLVSKGLNVVVYDEDMVRNRHQPELNERRLQKLGAEGLEIRIDTVQIVR